MKLICYRGIDGGLGQIAQEDGPIRVVGLGGRWNQFQANRNMEQEIVFIRAIRGKSWIRKKEHFSKPSTSNII